MTDRPSPEPEGLRIAAGRAGQSGDGRWDDDGDDEAWAQMGPPEGSPIPGEGGTRRQGRPGRGRRKRSATPAGPAIVAPAVVLPPVSPPAGTGDGWMPGPRPLPSTSRLKRQRQRRRRRRTLIACTFLTTVSTFVAGVGFVYLQSRLDQIGRVALTGLAGDAPGAATNVLLVSSDDLGGPQAANVDVFGKAEAQGPRSDTIMILHVDPAADKAAIVSVPRDLYVPIVGTASPDRVNTAFAQGGPERLIATLRQALGVTINHYIEVDFAGLRDIVDALGGIVVYLPYPARDTALGLLVDRSGCVALSGDQGVSWMRSRQLEFLVNGTWQPDGRGELGRSERQQDLVRRVLRMALSTGVTSPLRLNRVITAASGDVTVDSTLSTRDLRALGRRFDSLDPGKVALATLPTNQLDIAGRTVLTLQPTLAQPLIDVVNGKAPIVVLTTTIPPPAAVTTSTIAAAGGAGATSTTVAGAVKPADVRVRVLNGVGSPGVASKAATGLTSLGFSIADKGDAPAISPKTTIMYGAGQLAKAQLLQSSLLTTAVLKEDATLKAVDVNLVIGGDFTGVKAGISSGTSAASTTVAATVTTSSAARSNPASVAAAATRPPC